MPIPAPRLSPGRRRLAASARATAAEMIAAARLPPPGADPFEVEVTRGPLVESRHLVRAAVADARGALAARWGDVAGAVFPRSAIKPIQALTLVESGAAAAWGVSSAEIALACASHGGEPAHVAAVRTWLARLGLADADLQCGLHPPLYEPAARDLARAGEAPAPAHNNCSGKHAGLLTVARHLGQDTAGYLRPEHPVQVRVSASIAEISGCDVEAAPVAVDGCGIPTIGLPLAGLARAMARLGDPAAEAPARAEACRRVTGAMAAHPLMVAGHECCCTAVIEATGGEALVKTGAEGVFMAALPALGLGVALKVDDGARRAAEVAMLALLRHLGALDEAQAARLAHYVEAPVLSRAGARVGAVRVPGGPA